MSGSSYTIKNITGLTLTGRDPNPVPDKLWANRSAILSIHFIFVIYGQHLPKCLVGKYVTEANNFFSLIRKTSN